MKTAEGTYILSSAKAGEISLEDASWKLPNESNGHGAFTYAFLRGLKGEADQDKDGVIYIYEIFSFVSKQVPRITAEKGVPHHPHSSTTGTDMPIGVRIK